MNFAYKCFGVWHTSYLDDLDSPLDQTWKAKILIGLTRQKRHRMMMMVMMTTMTMMVSTAVDAQQLREFPFPTVHWRFAGGGAFTLWYPYGKPHTY